MKPVFGDDVEAMVVSLLRRMAIARAATLLDQAHEQERLARQVNYIPIGVRLERAQELRSQARALAALAHAR